MVTLNKMLLLPVLFFCFVPYGHAASDSKFGFGYGMDFRKGADLEQYELFFRKPLPYAVTISGLDVELASEFGLALIRETDTGGFGTARFSIMPEVVLRPHQQFSFILGLGAGIMVGQTAYSRYDLGGPILFAAKVGVHYRLNERWGLEYTFYHQSNGNIYPQNYSLNMNELALTYDFR